MEIFWIVSVVFVGHQGYDNIRQRLTERLHIVKIAKQLREYTQHCQDCHWLET